VHRIQQVLDAAVAAGTPAGVRRPVDGPQHGIASELGYLEVDPDRSSTSTTSTATTARS
jgi:hypothetical protein